MTANQRQTRLAAGGRPDAIWRPRRCQWIDGTPNHRDDCKCGLPVDAGSPYCREHTARAWQRRSGGDG